MKVTMRFEGEVLDVNAPEHMRPVLEQLADDLRKFVIPIKTYPPFVSNGEDVKRSVMKETIDYWRDRLTIEAPIS